MNAREIIFKSFKKSFRNIANAKYIFVVLFVTQLLFMIIVSAVFARYSVAFLEHSSAVMQPLQGTNLTLDGLRSIDPTNVYSEYKLMVQSIIMFFVLAYLCYIIINGVNWDLSNMIAGGKRVLTHYIFIFALLVLIFTLPAMFLINYMSRVLFNLELAGAVVIVGFVLFLIALYFMFISFSLVNKYQVNGIGHLLKNTFKHGFKDSNVLFPTYVIMFTPQAILFALASMLLEANFALLLLVLVLFILAVNWGRIYFLTTIRELI